MSKMKFRYDYLCNVIETDYNIYSTSWQSNIGYMIGFDKMFC